MFSHKIKSRTFSSFLRALSNILSHILELVLPILKPPPGERRQLPVDHKRRPQTGWNQKVGDVDSPPPSGDVRKMFRS